jgi:hypothetical protein
MPASMPDAATMLAAAILYLEDELMPELRGYHRFKIRVTANVLSTLRREIEQQSESGANERDRLMRLLGHSDSLANLNQELVNRIRDGSISIDDPALRSHIRASLREALSINNPRWLEE